MQITTERERHLGGVGGAEEYKEKYIRDAITNEEGGMAKHQTQAVRQQAQLTSLEQI